MAKRIWMARDVGEGPGEQDAPLARLWREGAAGLSDAELLAVLFGRGEEAANNPVLTVAENLLEAGGGLKAMCLRDPQELCAQPGMNPKKAAQLAAALELGRRVMRNGETRPILRTPEDIYAYLAPSLCGLQREQFRVLCLNSRGALTADIQVAQGSITSCPVDPRDVFHAAITAKATSIVLAHNHPSGDPTPSFADLELTRQLVSGAQLFCIRVLDHMVFGDWAFSSIARRGDLGAAMELKEIKWQAHGGAR
jgi:DNA repair protein RadC